MSQIHDSTLTSRCAVCAAPIHASRLMCLRHWRMVPRPLQARVLGAWTVLQGCRIPHRRRLALIDYGRERDAAIQAVQAADPQTSPRSPQ